MNYLQISIPILLRYNSVNLITPKIPLSYLPPVVIHAQLKSACTNLNKSMTSTTNVTTFIHIILLLHVFSQFHKYVFCHPSSTQVFSLLKSTPKFYGVVNRLQLVAVTSDSSSISSGPDASSPHVDIIEDVDVSSSVSPPYAIVASLSLSQSGEATFCCDSGI